MEDKPAKKPVYEYHSVAPIFENSINYGSNQIMEKLNIKRTAYSQWWKKYEKDKEYTDKKIEESIINIKLQLEEKEEKFRLIEYVLKDIYQTDFDTILKDYKR